MNCIDCNSDDVYECKRCSSTYCHDCLELDKECIVCYRRLCQSCPDLHCTTCNKIVCLFHFIECDVHQIVCSKCNTFCEDCETQFCSICHPTKGCEDCHALLCTKCTNNNRCFECDRSYCSICHLENREEDNLCLDCDEILNKLFVEDIVETLKLFF